ncbi:hypothetical protein I8752_18260 [Nostocaceae cyanobacterium CENA369]|uniref:Uncharacterized protein n=1 Tax=Dendronalium phyllosphericum CENA369 TaxID=1725256 RepID=A0A8J7I853_9NOST|nr:hypothetical protein [Dendronalium phyllosphericum]MBH8574926.1 hypothetical protein [Dendronalium phyllosphericum CENA369]
MTSFICDQIIDFEATHAYEAQDIERLIEQVQTSLAEMEGRKVVVLLRDAHYLTTRAFVILYNYIREPFSTNAVFVLVSGDKSRIFPPLLNLIEHRQQAA